MVEGNRPDSAPSNRSDDDLCAVLELEGGELVLYDRQNHRAWIQTDEAVEVLP